MYRTVRSISFGGNEPFVKRNGANLGSEKADKKEGVLMADNMMDLLETFLKSFKRDSGMTQEPASLLFFGCKNCFYNYKQYGYSTDSVHSKLLTTSSTHAMWIPFLGMKL
uniref:Ovule protein n=1 Tax=Rhabditophanes sp. KR3021 TaxID=114890 RepID=A0AC35TY10_9BILA